MRLAGAPAPVEEEKKGAKPAAGKAKAKDAPVEPEVTFVLGNESACTMMRQVIFNQNKARDSQRCAVKERWPDVRSCAARRSSRHA